jgi:uncharacterized DUF497 family protein
MIDWARIQRFDWDEGNSRKSVDKHGVSQVEAEQVFFNEPLLVVEDKRHSGREARFHALGRSDAGRLLHVTFTLRHNDTMIRVISARPMHRKERLRYEEET